MGIPVGLALGAIRMEKGYSLRQMAKQIPMNHTYYSQIEDWEISLSPSTLFNNSELMVDIEKHFEKNIGKVSPITNDCIVAILKKGLISCLLDDYLFHSNTAYFQEMLVYPGSTKYGQLFAVLIQKFLENLEGNQQVGVRRTGNPIVDQLIDIAFQKMWGQKYLSQRRTRAWTKIYYLSTPTDPEYIGEAHDCHDKRELLWFSDGKKLQMAYVLTYIAAQNFCINISTQGNYTLYENENINPVWLPCPKDRACQPSKCSSMSLITPSGRIKYHWPSAFSIGGCFVEEQQ